MSSLLFFEPTYTAWVAADNPVDYDMGYAEFGVGGDHIIGKVRMQLGANADEPNILRFTVTNPFVVQFIEQGRQLGRIMHDMCLGNAQPGSFKLPAGYTVDINPMVLTFLRPANKPLQDDYIKTTSGIILRS